MLVLSSVSTEYVRVAVATNRSGTVADPTGDTVALAFLVPGATPASGDWHTGDWETDSTVIPALHYARCLVGPSGGVLSLAAGIWDCWIRVTDSPEVPARLAGPIQVI